MRTSQTHRLHEGGISLAASSVEADKRQRWRHADTRWRWAWMKEWQSGGVFAGACASHRPMQHGSPLPTQYRPLPSLSLQLRNFLGQCMLSRTPKCAPHLPNTTMPTKSCTHLQLGSIAIFSTLPPAKSLDLLHYMGMECMGMECNNRVSWSRNSQFFKILYFQEFCLSRPRHSFQKSTTNHQKKIAGLCPAPPPYGAVPLLTTKVVAKCLAAVVLAHPDRVLSPHASATCKGPDHKQQKSCIAGLCALESRKSGSSKGYGSPKGLVALR